MQSSSTVTRLITRKNALDQSRIEQEQRSLVPAAGEVILKIDRCALTTNNITYAAYGNSMNYWGFFPTGLGNGATFRPGVSLMSWRPMCQGSRLGSASTGISRSRAICGCVRSG